MTEEATYYQKDNTGQYVAAALPSFADSLPEDIRGHESLKDMDAAALAKAYVEMKSSQPVIPEKPDGYELPKVPEGLPVDAEAMTGFKTLAHELKLTPAQVQKIIEFDFQRAQKYLAADKSETEAAAQRIQQNRTAAQTELEKEWGVNKEAKMELVAKVKTRFLSEDVIKKWNEAGFGDDPSLLKFLADIGSVMDEDRLILPDAKDTRQIPRTADGRPILRYDHPSSNPS